MSEIFSSPDVEDFSALLLDTQEILTKKGWLVPYGTVDDDLLAITNLKNRTIAKATHKRILKGRTALSATEVMMIIKKHKDAQTQWPNKKRAVVGARNLYCSVRAILIDKNGTQQIDVVEKNPDLAELMFDLAFQIAMDPKAKNGDKDSVLYRHKMINVFAKILPDKSTLIK